MNYTDEPILSQTLLNTLLIVVVCFEVRSSAGLAYELIGLSAGDHDQYYNL